MLNRYTGYLTDWGVFIVRLASSDTYAAVVKIIESNFKIVERYLSPEPPALVLVFRPTKRAGC